ncbi:MAG: hypothetical protein LBH29_01970 [Elusimicrobiota bacterium]|nr:hypothetical protein [Elusimicrobiota bacterium]
MYNNKIIYFESGLTPGGLGFDASSSVVILTQETAALADVSPAGVAKHYAKQLKYPFLLKSFFIAFCCFLFKGKQQEGENPITNRDSRLLELPYL